MFTMAVNDAEMQIQGVVLRWSVLEQEGTPCTRAIPTADRAAAALLKARRKAGLPGSPSLTQLSCSLFTIRLLAFFNFHLQRWM